MTIDREEREELLHGCLETEVREIRGDGPRDVLMQPRVTRCAGGVGNSGKRGKMSVNLCGCEIRISW